MSFFGELGLIWLVYRMVPSLSRKKHRKQSTIDMKDFEREEKLVCACTSMKVVYNAGCEFCVTNNERL